MYMKKIASLMVIVLVLLTSMVKGQKKAQQTNWPGSNYSYIKLYLFNLDNQLYSHYQALKNNQLNFTVVQPGVTLTPYQAKNLMTVLNGDTRILNEGLSKCYEPHHAFVFYDENDKIVAATDVCFLCEGIKFYPAKKYVKPITRYTEALTKDAVNKLDKIKHVINETEIPVFEQSINYIEYGKSLAKDTLKITNDSIFIDLLNSFQSLQALKNNVATSGNISIDSITRITGGGKKVKFYTLKTDKTYIETSSFAKGNLWTTEFQTTEKNVDIINAVSIHDTKIEIYNALKPAFADFFYNSVIKINTSNNNEFLIIGFDENSFVNFIKYHHYH